VIEVGEGAFAYRAVDGKAETRVLGQGEAETRVLGQGEKREEGLEDDGS